MANPSAVPQFLSRPGAGDFVTGFTLPARALSLIFKSRKLFWLTALSSLVTLVTLSVVVVLAWRYAPQLVSWVFARPGNWAGDALWGLVVGLTFLMLLALGANTLPLLVLAPLQDPLSEATEAVCGDFAPPPFSLARLLQGTGVALVHTVARVSVMLLGVAVLFPLNFIPGAGSLAWTALSSLWTIFWLATEYLDAPMARHLYRFRQVTQVARKRLALSMGLGAAVYVLLWVPVINFFFVPIAIVSGTLLFRGLRASGDLPPPAAAA